MAVEDCAEDRRAAFFRGRHEEPQAPGDDLRGEAKRLQLRHGAVGEAGQLDTMRAHDERAADLKIVGEIEHRPAAEDSAPGLRQRELWRTVDAEALIDVIERLGRDEAADHAFAIIGLEAIDAHILRRQPVPDRQQEAGDDVERALGEFGDARAFRLPQR